MVEDYRGLTQTGFYNYGSTLARPMVPFVFANDSLLPIIIKKCQELGLKVHHNKHGTIDDGVVVVTEPLMMRGLDYRSASGFILVIATQLKNHRAFMQALGRVGRYEEPCERYIEPGLEPVDNVAETTMFGKLLDAMHHQSTQQQNPKQ